MLQTAGDACVSSLDRVLVTGAKRKKIAVAAISNVAATRKSPRECPTNLKLPTLIDSFIFTTGFTNGETNTVLTTMVAEPIPSLSEVTKTVKTRT